MQGHKHTQELQSVQTYNRTSRGRCSCKGLCFHDAARRFGQVCFPFLGRSWFCLQTICLAPRRAEGAQMDRFFDNSLKTKHPSTTAPYAEGPASSESCRTTLPPWLGPARTPARSLTCRELANISRSLQTLPGAPLSLLKATEAPGQCPACTPCTPGPHLLQFSKTELWAKERRVER